MNYVAEMVAGSIIHIQSFMTIGLGVQVILRLLPQQSERLQSVGIADGTDLGSMPLRWPLVARSTCIYQVS
jgi:hypothetical protein